jgi:hypothetical protein
VAVSAALYLRPADDLTGGSRLASRHRSGGTSYVLYGK